MNFADIENTWRSPHNRPSPAALDQMKMKFIADLRRRNRGFWFFITPVLVALTLLTAQVVRHVLAPAPGTDRIDFAREWGFVLMLALPWAAAIYFLRAHRRHRRAHRDYERSIPDCVRALLDENRVARNRLKVAALLHGTFLLLLPVVVFQLRAAGKAGDEILVPAFVLWPLIALGIGIGIWFHHHRKLAPEKRALEEVLASY